MTGQCFSEENTVGSQEYCPHPPVRKRKRKEKNKQNRESRVSVCQYAILVAWEPELLIWSHFQQNTNVPGQSRKFNWYAAGYSHFCKQPREPLLIYINISSEVKQLDWKTLGVNFEKGTNNAFIYMRDVFAHSPSATYRSKPTVSQYFDVRYNLFFIYVFIYMNCLTPFNFL